MRLRSCLMMVSMSFCLSLSVFRNCAKTLFFLLVSLILIIENKNKGIDKETEEMKVQRELKDNDNYPF